MQGTLLRWTVTRAGPGAAAAGPGVVVVVVVVTWAGGVRGSPKRERGSRALICSSRLGKIPQIVRVTVSGSDYLENSMTSGDHLELPTISTTLYGDLCEK